MLSVKYLLLAPCLALTGCFNTPADVCQSTITTPILAATGPRTITLSQKADFIVQYQPQNSCGKFAGFPEATSGTTLVVGVNVKYDGCSCAAVSATQATYTFQPTKTGTYYLHFLADNAVGYIADTLVVN